MNDLRKFGFIGVGNMATAIIRGAMACKAVEPGNVYLYDVNSAKTTEFTACGAHCTQNAGELVRCSDVVFLCVKPQNFEQVLQEIQTEADGRLFVSIGAGISIAYIQSVLGMNTAVIRVMPNTPLLLGQGACAVSCSTQVTPVQQQLIFGVFSSCGKVVPIREDQMNAVIGVNGSSPAYIYLFAKAVAQSAQKQGIDYDTAMQLFVQTLIGSAQMLSQPGANAQQLIDMVSSKGGTTIAALQVLYEHNFEDVIDQAMQACTRRAGEIGR